jgi:hypothetical protein
MPYDGSALAAPRGETAFLVREVARYARPFVLLL